RRRRPGVETSSRQKAEETRQKAQTRRQKKGSRMTRTGSVRASAWRLVTGSSRVCALCLVPCLLLVPSALSLVSAQLPTTRPLRIIAFGAHPDDAELKFAGTATLLAAKGAKVKLVALTNGDVGHFSQAGG